MAMVADIAPQHATGEGVRKGGKGVSPGWVLPIFHFLDPLDCDIKEGMKKLFVAFAFTLLMAKLAGGPFLASAGPPEANSRTLTCFLLSGSKEYRSKESLMRLEDFLGERYRLKFIHGFTEDRSRSVPHLDRLAQADLLVLFARRLELPSAELALIQSFIDKGNPVLGIRTASHAFQTWPEDWRLFDRKVMGGNYNGHYGRAEARIHVADPDHPILENFTPFTTHGKLYKNPDLPGSSHVMLRASTDNYSEPVAWTHVYKDTRMFYTSLGVPEDFQKPAFQRMLANALFWLTETRKEDFEK